MNNKKTKLLVENWRKLIERDENLIDIATPAEFSDSNYNDDLSTDMHYEDEYTNDISEKNDCIRQIIESLEDLNCDSSLCDTLEMQLQNCDDKLLDTLCRCLTVCIK